jgi:hypothetical protein
MICFEENLKFVDFFLTFQLFTPKNIQEKFIKKIKTWVRPEERIGFYSSNNYVNDNLIALIIIVLLKKLIGFYSNNEERRI